MRVPDEAGSGSAKLTVSFPDWKAGKVAPATYHLPIVDKGKLSDLLRFDVVVKVAGPFGPVNEAKKGDGAILKVRRGQTVRIEINGIPKEGFHTYPLSVTDAEPQAELSKITLVAVKGIERVGTVGEAPEASRVKRDNRVIFEHDKPFTWMLDVRIGDDAAPGMVDLAIKVKTIVCDERTCHLFDTEVSARFEVTALPAPATKEARPPAKKVEPKPEAARKHKPFVGLISVSHVLSKFGITGLSWSPDTILPVRSFGAPISFTATPTSSKYSQATGPDHCGPDGTIVASASNDAAVTLWDVNAKKENPLRPFRWLDADCLDQLRPGQRQSTCTRPKKIFAVSSSQGIYR